MERLELSAVPGHRCLRSCEACSCTCGGGTMRRNRVIQQSPAAPAPKRRSAEAPKRRSAEAPTPAAGRSHAPNRKPKPRPRHGGRTCDPEARIWRVFKMRVFCVFDADVVCEEKGQIAPCATQSCEMCVDGRRGWQKPWPVFCFVFVSLAARKNF